MVLNVQSVEQMILEQKKYFYSGATKDIEFRKEQLIKLKTAIQTNEKEIIDALYKDLRKSEFEAYATEVGLVLNSISHMIKHIDKWVRPIQVKTPLQFQPGKSFIVRDPYGVVLIIGPFNYPFQLVIEPLLGAIIGGNTAIIKPSELSIHTTAIIKKIVEEIFEEKYIRIVEGEKELVQQLIHAPFDYIFFTGSIEVGKIVMRAAAERLTPISLELGGKSPVIVDETANLGIAAKRIIWGKFTNAGQSCVAPDYLFVHASIYEKFIEKLKKTIEQYYGENPQKSPDFGRIINERHFQRIEQVLEADAHLITFGGQKDISDLYMAPTLLEGVTWESKVMESEIFGPILPIMKYTDITQAIHEIRQLTKPLAAYLFSENEQAVQFFLQELPFGGGSINDTMSHVGNVYLPFGGVGSSGMNVYHGKASYESFTHPKSILKRSSKLASDLSYPPYKEKVKIVRKIIK
ncbi:aldehyde dehydrogenase [Paenibacillus sp. tmac-D7]|uniref:aldehyde dehydrogenase n=1 Tax=Paenibacillus sp. tmac-D7 TaxID=2591462 RepID=UPI001144AB4E|nr:aldehyde dehydrogenase [Paenibacillus sp. tmac-D7]